MFQYILSWIFICLKCPKYCCFPQNVKDSINRGDKFFLHIRGCKVKILKKSKFQFFMRRPLSYFHYCGLHYNYCIVMLIVVKGFKLCIAQCCSQVLMRRSIIPTFNNLRKLKTFFSQRFLLTLTHPSYLKIRIAVRNARFERHLSWGVNVPFLLIFFRCEGWWRQIDV